MVSKTQPFTCSYFYQPIIAIQHVHPVYLLSIYLHLHFLCQVYFDVELLNKANWICPVKSLMFSGKPMLLHCFQICLQSWTWVLATLRKVQILHWIHLATLPWSNYMRLLEKSLSRSTPQRGISHTASSSQSHCQD